MVERIGANGMPMKPKEEKDEMLSEILEVNPNKKSKKEEKKEEDLSSDWSSDEEVEHEEL